MAAIADRYAAQIPTGGYPSVASDDPVNSTETGRNVSNALMAVPGAGPAMMAFRGLAGASKAAPIASNLISTVARTAAPAAPFIPPVAGGAGLIAAAATPTASPAVTTTTPSVVQPATTAVTPAAATAAAVPDVTDAATPGVITRRGNTYSGTDVKGTGPIVNARNPDAGVSVLPSTGVMSNPITDMALAAARTAAASRGDFDAVNASYGGQPAGLTDSQLMSTASAPLGTSGKGFARQMLRDRMQDSTQRRGQDINAAQIAGTNLIAGKRLDIEAATANLDIAGKKKLQAAQDTYLNAKTQVEKDAAAEAIRALTGKNELPNRFTVVPGGQSIDPATGLAITQPAQVLDNQLGQLVDLTGQRPSNAAQKYEKGKVYTDAKGKKATWDGTKFVPST